MEPLSTHIQCVKYSSYSYLTSYVLMLLISTRLTTQHLHEAQNKSANRVRTLKYSLEGCLFALISFLYFLLMSLFFFAKATTTKTKTLELFLSIISIFLKP